jgi:ubiquitin-conjugating enzyme E2 O
MSGRPGDHVVWKNEDQERTAIVQSVNASERTASVLFSDSGVIDTASLLELDPHGTTNASASGTHESLGVRRGDFVFIHPDGATNGLEKPRVPRIGEVEAWVRDAPVQADGQLAGWRREMSEIGIRIATQGVNPVEEGQIKRLFEGDSSLSWFGEVTGVSGIRDMGLLDGRQTCDPFSYI